MNDLDSKSTLHCVAQERTKNEYKVAPKAAPNFKFEASAKSSTRKARNVVVLGARPKPRLTGFFVPMSREAFVKNRRPRGPHGHRYRAHKLCPVNLCPPVETNVAQRAGQRRIAQEACCNSPSLDETALSRFCHDSSKDLAPCDCRSAANCSRSIPAFRKLARTDSHSPPSRGRVPVSLP